MTPSSTDTPRWARAMMLIIPAMWIGLIIGISFIEAPLKFTAPGITIPLGLGIGRRVFLAMNITEVVLAIILVLSLIKLWRSHRIHPLEKFQQIRFYSFIAVGLLLIKTVIIRPILAIESDAVLAGTSPGGSSTHFYYIGVEAILFIALVLLVTAAVRGLLVPQTPHQAIAAQDINASS
ncbi:MAG TPA: hypothetical protein H9884_07890 [Candidatus Yaniella excrementigallinarum]|nr:hypothetical protein [Candidatus Yaniella excrementigallinarum]